MSGDERRTLGVRGDVLLGVALQASLIASASQVGQATRRAGSAWASWSALPMSASTRLMAISDCVTPSALRHSA